MTLADRIEPLDRKRHGRLRLVPERVAAGGASVRMVPLVVSEFLKAAVQYPVLLTKNAATGRFLPVALFGFEEGENLFWQEETWDGIYLPLNIARLPFFLAPKDEEGGDYLLCIDRMSDSLDDTEGEPLFGHDGSESELLRARRDMLLRLLEGERHTGAFIAALLEADILIELVLDIKFANGEKCRMQGLYSIDEAKLDALGDDVLLGLRKAGYLPMIYAMIVSVSQIFALIERRNRADARARQWFAPGGDD